MLNPLHSCNISAKIQKIFRKLIIWMDFVGILPTPDAYLLPHRHKKRNCPLAVYME